MKWTAKPFGRSDRKRRRKLALNNWHARFAYLPVVIPEQSFDGIVVPRHYLWLERYATISRDRDCLGPYVLKSYANEPTRSQMARDTNLVPCRHYTNRLVTKEERAKQG